MSLRLTLPLALVLAGGALSAQEANPNGNRMGVALYGFRATGRGASDFSDPGVMVSLQVHFNRESPLLSRLRIDYGRVDSTGDLLTGTNSVDGSPEFGTIRRETWAVGYELLPHFGETSRSGAFAILGVGGAWWRDSWDTRPTNFWGAHHDDDIALQITVGGGYRLNTHVAFEGRYTHSSFTTQAAHPPRGTRRDHLSAGLAFRF